MYVLKKQFPFLFKIDTFFYFQKATDYTVNFQQMQS